MSNIIEFKKNSALRGAAPSSVLLSALAVSAALDATPAPAATLNVNVPTATDANTHLILGQESTGLGFGLPAADLLSRNASDVLDITGYALGFRALSGGFIHTEEHSFSIFERETEITRAIDAGLAESKETRYIELALPIPKTCPSTHHSAANKSAKAAIHMSSKAKWAKVLSPLKR